MMRTQSNDHLKLAARPNGLSIEAGSCQFGRDSSEVVRMPGLSPTR